jgi:hypothetical protein
MRWAGYVAYMGINRNASSALVGKPEGKRPLVSKVLSLHKQMLWQDHKIFHPHILIFKARMLSFVKLTKNYMCLKIFSKSKLFVCKLKINMGLQ